MGETRLVIDSSFGEVERVGDAVRELYAREGFPSDEAAMIELAVVEAVNNAIEHAYGSRSGGEVTVSMAVDPRSVEVVIEDQGKPLDPMHLATASRKREFDPADRMSIPEGGRGLPIIRAVFDDVHFERVRGGNRLRLRKRRHPAPS